jgi:hypothetical protein
MSIHESLSPKRAYDRLTPVNTRSRQRYELVSVLVSISLLEGGAGAETTGSIGDFDWLQRKDSHPASVSFEAKNHRFSGLLKRNRPNPA